MLTSWTKGPEEPPLYSDWKVSFTAHRTVEEPNDGPSKDDQDTHSVSTASTTSADGEDSVDNSESKMVVESMPSPQCQQQHAYFSVHRNIIGPQSTFFTESFLSSQVDSNTVIALPTDLPPHAFDAVVEAFRILLDHCYHAGARAGNPKALDVLEKKLGGEHNEKATIVAVFCLSRFFEMDSQLCQKVHEFVSTDLTPDTVAAYYAVVKCLRSSWSSSSLPAVLDFNPIMDMIILLCHRIPSVLSPDSDLSRIADLSLWLSIGSLLARDNDYNETGDSNIVDGDGAAAANKASATAPSGNDDNESKDDPTGESPTTNSKAWSENLTYFFDTYHQQESVVDLRDSFRTLTAESVLPEVSEKVALRLLEQEHKHGLAWGSSKTPKGHGEPESDEETVDTVVDEMETDHEEDEQEESTTETAAAVETQDLSPENENAAVARRLTGLQERCIKALCESNWAGDENEVKDFAPGKLASITTPAVLEALLVASVAEERHLGSRLRETASSLATEQKLRAEDSEKYDFFTKEHKFDIARELQRQMALANKVKEESEKRKAAEEIAKSVESRVADEKKALQKVSEVLEAQLEAAEKKVKSLEKRLRVLEKERSKTESDRELYEHSVRETIKRLDGITNPFVEDDWCLKSCGGFTPLITMMSTVNDHRECDRIKAMLKRVLPDSSVYEGDFSLKGDDDFTLVTKDDDYQLTDYEDDGTTA